MLGGMRKPVLKRTRAVAPEDDFSFKNPIYKKKYLKFNPPAKRLKFAEDGKYVTLNPKNIAALTQALNPVADPLKTIVSSTPDDVRLAEIKKNLDDPTKYSAEQRRALQQEYDKLLNKLYGEAKPSSLAQASEFTPRKLFDINREDLQKQLALRYEYIFDGMGIENITDNAIQGVAEMMLDFFREETSRITTQGEYHALVKNMLELDTIMDALEDVYPELGKNQAAFVTKVNEIIGNDQVTLGEELLAIFQQADNEIPLGMPGMFDTPTPSAPASPFGGPEEPPLEEIPSLIRTPSVPGTRTIFETTEEDDLKNKDFPLFASNEAKVKLSDGSFAFIDIENIYEDKKGNFTTRNIDGSIVTFKTGSKQHTDVSYLLKQTGFTTIAGRAGEAQPEEPIIDDAKEEKYEFTPASTSIEPVTNSQVLYFLNDQKFKNVRDKQRYNFIITKKEGQNYNQYFIVLDDFKATEFLNNPNLKTLAWTSAINALTGAKKPVVIVPHEFPSNDDEFFENDTFNAVNSILDAGKPPADAKAPSGGPTGFAGDYTRFFEETSGGRDFIPVSADAYAVIRERYPELPPTPDRRLFMYRGSKGIVKVGEVRYTPNNKQKYGFRQLGDTQFRNMKQTIGKEMNDMMGGSGYMSGRGSRRRFARMPRPTGPRKKFDFVEAVDAGASSLFDNRKAIASGLKTGAHGLASLGALGAMLYLNEKKKKAQQKGSGRRNPFGRKKPLQDTAFGRFFRP